jgi:hypothetical protein
MEEKQEGLTTLGDTIRHEIAVAVLDRNMHPSEVAIRKGIAVESVNSVVEDEKTNRKIRKEGQVTMPKRNVVARKKPRKKYKKRSGYTKHMWSPEDLLYVAKTWPDYKKPMKKFGVTKLAVKCAVGRLRDAGMKGLLPLRAYNSAGVKDPYKWAVKEALRRKMRVGGKAFTRTKK